MAARGQSHMPVTHLEADSIRTIRVPMLTPYGPYASSNQFLSWEHPSKGGLIPSTDQAQRHNGRH